MKNENFMNSDAPETDEETASDRNLETAKKTKYPAAIVNKEKIERAISNSVYASMGIGVLLLPVFSLVSVTAIQLNMVRIIAKSYGVDFKENVAKKIITAVVAAGVPVLATGPVELVALGIPVFGTAFAFATMPALNGMSTYSVGRMFVNHFERGGSFVGASVDTMKEDFTNAFQRSREWLGEKISGTTAQ